ncbi:MAG: ABC transporter ATP-binding protein [Desulfatibacillum sp.]|nr:ABC transporter ATP-binding protein [Desulfatibacillum sp.]
MSVLLEVKNIETYYDLIYAVRGVSLSVEEGGITTVLGNNGAGKSTILKTIMGLIDDQPDKGTIEFDGKRIDGKETEDIVRMGIAYVPEGREVFNELTVQENLLMGAHTRKDRSALKHDFEKIYSYFPILADRVNQWAGTLSGGEQQMLAIGRALMSRPRLLILDEPSLGLSPLLVKEIFEIIKIIRNQGVTILLVEQNARKALGISDFGLILENGRFVMAGPCCQLLEDQDVKEFYLGFKAQESAKGYQRWKRKKRWR